MLVFWQIIDVLPGSAICSELIFAESEHAFCCRCCCCCCAHVIDSYNRVCPGSTYVVASYNLTLPCNTTGELRVNADSSLLH